MLNKDIFYGTIQIAETDYGDLVVIKDNSTVPSSPWWYASIHNYINEFLTKRDKPGTIFELFIRSSIKKKKDGARIIFIKKLKEKIIT